MACRLASLVLLTVVVLTLPAAAAITASVGARGRVQVLQPSAASPRVRRCLTRLREELTSGGFEVVSSEFGAGGDSLWTVDPPRPQDGSLATITLIGNPDEGPAELWIVDGGVAGARSAVRRLLLPAGSTTHDDEVLAVRTLEFLRASARELARAAESAGTTTPTSPRMSPPPSPSAVAVAPATTNVPTDSTTAAPPVRSRSPGPLSLEAGVGLLEGSRSLGPAYLPLARLRAELASSLEGRLTVAAFGTRPRVPPQQAGTATVDYTMAVLELRATFRQGRAVRPAVGVGGGVLRVRVDGTGAFPYKGQSGQVWAGLFDLGAGVTIALGGRLALALEAHGQVAAPYPTVQVLGDEAARIGRPALLASVTLVTAL